MFHFVDPVLIIRRGMPVSLSSMPFFKACRPRISAASIALWVVSPADSNSNSMMAVIFIGSLHNSRSLDGLLDPPSDTYGHLIEGADAAAKAIEGMLK